MTRGTMIACLCALTAVTLAARAQPSPVLTTTKVVASETECLAFLDRAEGNFVQFTRSGYTGSSGQGVSGTYSDGTRVEFGCSGNVLTIQWYVPE